MQTAGRRESLTFLRGTRHSWRLRQCALALCALAWGCGGTRAEDVITASSHQLAEQEKRFKVSMPEATPLGELTVGASDKLVISDRAQVKNHSGQLARVTNSGATATEIGVQAKVGGVTSIAPVTLRPGAIVQGDISSLSTIAGAPTATAAGPINARSPINTTPYAWRVKFPTTSTAINLQPGQTVDVAPGAYTKLSIPARAQARLRSGTYFVDAFNVESQGGLSAITTTGAVRIYVRQQLTFRGSLTFSGPSDRLFIAYAGSQDVILESPFTGTVVAPEASLRLATGGATHSGSFFGKTLIVDPDVKVSGFSSGGWAGLPFEVAPTFNCIEARSDGSSVALFGYNNPDTQSVTLPSDRNAFVPAPADRGQPTAFLPGSHANAFGVRYAGAALKWSLNGFDAVVTPSVNCPATIDVATIADAAVKPSSRYAADGYSSALDLSSAGDGAIVRFSRNSIKAWLGTARLIKKARLVVPVISGAASASAYPMNDSWEEASVTFSCRNDQDPSTTTGKCNQTDRWLLAPRPDTFDNPYDVDGGVVGSQEAGHLAFDITESLQDFVTRSDFEPSWFVQTTAGSVMLGSREGNKPARIIVDSIATSDQDTSATERFGFVVDPSLAPRGTLPALEDGRVRPLEVLHTSDGHILQFARNELVVLTDSASELDAIKRRWNAVEVRSARVSLPGLARAHVLRLELSKANPETLSASLRALVPRTEGEQRVSSDAALRMLSAAATERLLGSQVAVNWIIPGADVDVRSLATKTLLDGPSNTSQELSSNAFDWANFGAGMHDVIEAWKLLFFSGKLKPSVDVAIIDAGYFGEYMDLNRWRTTCAGNCENPFDCGGGEACPWHGTHVASSGFGAPNNNRAAAGPGAGVSDVLLFYGFGDMATLLLEVPGLVAAGNEIVNISAAIPVPDYLFFTTEPAELVLKYSRKVAGVLFFAAAGNDGRNVDKRRCYGALGVEVCPWEETTWFPCESPGVSCVGATEYARKERASYSNSGNSIRYWASGNVLTPMDGTSNSSLPQEGFTMRVGTSYASPFMAGIASLTWAADRSQSAGDVEECLARGRTGGPSGRFVQAYLATACALNPPDNLAPAVQITSPPEEFATIEGLQTVRLSALVADNEGQQTKITWYSSIEGLIGSTYPGEEYIWAPASSGVHDVTARAYDSGGLYGEDHAVLTFGASAPFVKITAPASDGTEIVAGLPFDVSALAANYTSLGSVQPCSTTSWTGFGSDNEVAFSSVPGCVNQAMFPMSGASRIDVRMNANGLVGEASRLVHVVSDGKLHVKITAPAKDLNGEFFLKDGANEFRAVGTADGATSMQYTWSIEHHYPGNVIISTVYGQNASWTPTHCGGWVHVTVMNFTTLGEFASDTVTGYVEECPPR